jgi:hypothetical protein
MGHIRHNAIIVTGFQAAALVAAEDFAKSVGAKVIGPDESPINGYHTLLIAPDGSKEGWHESDIGDLARAKIRAWLEAGDSRQQYFEWAEIAYGNDDSKAEIVHSRWEPTP